MELDRGIIVVTGDSKGKTTTALGYVLRFLGDGKRVRMVQFMKGGGFSGELFTESFFSDRFKISQFGGSCRFSAEIGTGTLKCQKCGECFRESKDAANDWAGKAMAAAKEALQEGYDLLVLDEAAHAVKNGLLKVDLLQDFLRLAAGKTLVIVTGRGMPDEVIALSDYAVECCMIKHPKDRGVSARRGIEY